MSFSDEDRERIRNFLSNSESVKTYFDKNREKFSNDRERFTISSKKLEDLLDSKNMSIPSNDVLGLQKIFVDKTFQTFSDTADLIEIAFGQIQQMRKEILELGLIMKKSGKEQQEHLDSFNEKLRKQEQQVSDIVKHKTNLEWLDKYFKHASEDTDDR